MCPAAIKHLVQCLFPGISPGSRRKPALAQDFPIQSDHERTRWASSPFSICSAAKKNESQIICAAAPAKGAARSGDHRLGVPAAPVQGPRQAGARPSAFHGPSAPHSACSQAGEMGPGKMRVSHHTYALTIALVAPLAPLPLTPRTESTKAASG